MSDAKAKLLDLLLDRSYRKGQPGEFLLSSGKRSDFYIDCKQTTLSGVAMPFIGECCAAFVPDDAVGVGGLTLGADPIAAATAYYLASTGRPIEAFVVRKEPKKHGTEQWIEGRLPAGAKLVVIDDVVTTGGSTIDAIRKCRGAGHRVVAVIALVDREEGGLETIRVEAGSDVAVHAVLNKTGLEAAWRARRT